MASSSVDPLTGDEVDDLAQAVAESLTCKQSGSKLGKLDECPVCCMNMDDLGNEKAQEEHLKACLDSDSGLSQSDRNSEEEIYLLYRLPEQSTLIGVECDICLEEFAKETDVARLACFCVFHSECFLNWFEKRSSCPVHVLGLS